MVSPYYLILLKMFQNTSNSIQNNKKIMFKRKNKTNVMAENCNKYVHKECRICLKVGTIPIYSDDDKSDLSSAVSFFGEIEIKESDMFSKFLCEPCHKLLQSAILFRATAKQSDKILRCSMMQYTSDTEDLKDSDSINASDKYIDNKDLSIDFSPMITDDKKTKLKIHTFNKKSNVNKVQCSTCQKIVTKAYFPEHYALHDSSISKYVCHVCGKSFRQRSAHINHSLIHSKEFKFHCKVCPYKGRTSALLKTHVRIHSRDYRYMCTECPARFLTKSNLNRHNLKHKEPMFKCDSCKRGFHSKLILERHFAADHLGIKNHICNLCGKAFGYRKAMMQHQLEVHKRVKKSHGRAPAYLEAESRIQEKINP